jgi:hypothetical protein
MSVLSNTLLLDERRILSKTMSSKPLFGVTARIVETTGVLIDICDLA